MAVVTIVAAASGVLFGILDGVIHGNPLAQLLYEVYQPIARETINVPAGVAIDLFYGFVLAGLFLLLYKSLPGQSGWLKGWNYGLMMWFFRVVMGAASTWMMFKVPAGALAYSLTAGLGEMLIMGVVYGLTLRPVPN